MQLLDYLEVIESSKLNELDRVKLLMFYHLKEYQQTMFTMKHISNIVIDAGFPSPNTSRLKVNMLSCKTFKYDKISKNFSFLPVSLQSLEKQYSPLFENTEEIKSESEYIDETKFCGYRGYIDKLIRQINSCYANNCFDACAVLMRRLFEICLILSYQNLGVDSQIKNQDSSYFMLEKIVSNAKNNATLNLSRIKDEYDKIRNIGNFAAHRIEYNTSKRDIDGIKIIYRTALEELFYKAGFMK